MPPGEKAKGFPAAPGVYLMKDADGRVIYVGKAKNLRNRASHYFTKAALDDERTADLVKLRAAIQVLQRVFKFRTCGLDIKSSNNQWRWFRPCILHSIHQCTAPCNFRVSRDDYRKQIRRLFMVLEGKKDKLIAHLEKAMQDA